MNGVKAINIQAAPAVSLLEESPIAIANPGGLGRLVLICEHASHVIPASYRGLGLSEVDQRRHIAWDIGALAVSKLMSEHFDAPLVHATCSRLLLDLNRDTTASDSIVSHSENIPIPGNLYLADSERMQRQKTIYAPFHTELAALIDQRLAAGQDTAIVSIHSFTRVYLGVSRPWQIGVIAQHDRRLADGLLLALSADSSLCVGDNQPYGPHDGVYHTVGKHGQARGLACAMIEICNDLIEHADGQRQWADLLQSALTAALAQPGIFASR